MLTNSAHASSSPASRRRTKRLIRVSGNSGIGVLFPLYTASSPKSFRKNGGKTKRDIGPKGSEESMRARNVVHVAPRPCSFPGSAWGAQNPRFLRDFAL